MERDFPILVGRFDDKRRVEIPPLIVGGTLLCVFRINDKPGIIEFDDIRVDRETCSIALGSLPHTVR